jgi:hypothetical protein
MDKRTDDFIGEVQVRSNDSQEIKSFELFAHEFRVNDATGEVDFIDVEVRDRLHRQVTAAVLLTVRHEIEAPDDPEPPHSDRPEWG